MRNGKQAETPPCWIKQSKSTALPACTLRGQAVRLSMVLLDSKMYSNVV